MGLTSIRSARIVRNRLITTVAVSMGLSLMLAGGASLALAATTFTVNTIDDWTWARAPRRIAVFGRP